MSYRFTTWYVNCKSIKAQGTTAGPPVLLPFLIHIILPAGDTPSESGSAKLQSLQADRPSIVVWFDSSADMQHRLVACDSCRHLWV
jgi:hypothetical protein